MLQSLVYLRLPRSKLLHHTPMDLCTIYTLLAVPFFFQSCRRVVDFRLKDQGTPILSIGSEDQLLQGKFIKNSFNLNLEKINYTVYISAQMLVELFSIFRRISHDIATRYVMLWCADFDTAEF